MTGCSGAVAEIRKSHFFQILINSIDYMFGNHLLTFKKLPFLSYLNCGTVDELVKASLRNSCTYPYQSPGFEPPNEQR
jgi:hypothetical protein